MKSKDLVHLRFEYAEALESVRDILYIEKSLMIISRKMRSYSMLRNEKNKMKIKLNEKVANAKKVLIKMQKNIPEVRVPKVSNKTGVREKISEIAEDSDIESQLKDIQEKLNSISRQQKF